MKSTSLLRIAAGFVLFFALGHSIGHFTRHSVTDPKALEVLKIMSENKFDMFGQLRSYDENYTGMSLNLIVTLLSFAAILIMLSRRIKYDQSVVILLVPVAFALAVFAVTSFVYFFPMPAIASLIAFVLVGMVIVKQKSG